MKSKRGKKRDKRRKRIKRANVRARKTVKTVRPVAKAITVDDLVPVTVSVERTSVKDKVLGFFGRRKSA